MSKDFAKIFNIDEIGQVVVIFQGADETGNPELRFFAAPEGLGVCSIAVQSDNDNDETWDSFEELFESRNQENVTKMVQPLLDASKAMLSD